MSYEDAKNILKICRNLGARYVTILGGEPTLHPQLVEIVYFANTLGYEQITIDTNGILVHHISDISPALLKYVSVSLDGGTSETNDDIRGDGAFNKSLKGIKWLVDNGYSVRLNCTVTKKNLDDLEQFLDLAESLGIRLVNFHSFTGEGNGRLNMDLDITAVEWHDFCNRLKLVANIRNIAVWYPPTWVSKDELRVLIDEGFRGCLGISLDRLSIFPDGRCYTCSVFFDEDNYFAQYEAGKFTMNRQESEYDQFCKAVYISDSLEFAGCPAENLLRDAGADGTDLYSVCRCWKTHA
jgi:MoaA/NifB/PqqE/SkfB family radical SAM enzyme